jgi:hypothetical protein
MIIKVGLWVDHRPTASRCAVAPYRLPSRP